MVRHERLLREMRASLLLQAEPSWMPSQVMVDMIEPIQPSYNIKKIEALQTKQRDIASKLGATWLGQVYRSHLKRYVIIRWIVQGTWRNIYAIHVKFYVKFIAIHLVNRKSSR